MVFVISEASYRKQASWELKGLHVDCRSSSVSRNPRLRIRGLAASALESARAQALALRPGRNSHAVQNPSSPPRYIVAAPGYTVTGP